MPKRVRTPRNTRGKFDSFGGFRTWVDINKNAARKNIQTFKKIIGSKVKLWAVVKSNAYGHGLLSYSKLVSHMGLDGFCVDSLVEGLKLRKHGIRKFILVLGPTLANLSGDAERKNITISISNFDILKPLAEIKTSPFFHLKTDTGMRRQGFFIDEIPKVIKFLESNPALREKLTGVFTHFASAKDINYPTYTEVQFQEFQKIIRLFERAGYKNLIRHAAATGGTLIDPKYHLDAVRVGIGLFGHWPTKELEIQPAKWRPKISLKPILSWKTIISEIKNLKTGDYIGYDLIEQMSRPTKVAILPIGYWHGFPRSLSSVGEVLVNGKRARILGRVSMDLTAIDITGIKCQIGDQVILVGKDRGEQITAYNIAMRSGTTHYEFLTRLNPLMERVVK